MEGFIRCEDGKEDCSDNAAVLSAGVILKKKDYKSSRARVGVVACKRPRPREEASDRACLNIERRGGGVKRTSGRRR
jgi:hypothetical protein